MVQGGSRKGKGKAVVKEESSGEEYDDLYASDTPEEPNDGLCESSHDDSFDVEAPSQIQPEDVVANAEDRFLRSTPSSGRKKVNAYVVYCGWKTGVFGTWSATYAQIRGFRGCSHQGFASIEDANSAWEHALAIGAVWPHGVHGPTIPTHDPRMPTLPAYSTESSRRRARHQHAKPPKPLEAADWTPKKHAADTPHLKELRAMPRSRKNAAAGVAFTPLGEALSPAPPAASSQQPSPPALFSGPTVSYRYPPSISSATLAGPSFIRDRFEMKSRLHLASTSSRAIPSHSTRATPSVHVMGDPWFVVLRGDCPGAYADRPSALAALGQGAHLGLEKVATRQRAYELFTLAFMDGLVFTNDV